MKGSPLTDSIADYLDHVKSLKSAATSYQTTFLMERVLLPWATATGITDPSQITDRVMDKFTGSLRDRAKPLSGHTVNSYVRGIRTYLNFAGIDKGRYRAPKPPKDNRPTLKRYEIQAMVAAATDERDALIVQVLADCGLRSGELLGLRLEDLKEESGRQYFLKVNGKTGPHTVPIIGTLFRRLRNYGENPERDFIFSAKRRTNGEFEKLTPNGLAQLIRNLGVEAGIKHRVWPTAFRHFYITDRLNNGASLAHLQQAVGHSSPHMILSVYAHVRPEDGYAELTRGLK